MSDLKWVIVSLPSPLLALSTKLFTPLLLIIVWLVILQFLLTISVLYFLFDYFKMFSVPHCYYSVISSFIYYIWNSRVFQKLCIITRIWKKIAMIVKNAFILFPLSLCNSNEILCECSHLGFGFKTLFLILYLFLFKDALWIYF